MNLRPAIQLSLPLDTPLKCCVLCGQSKPTTEFDRNSQYKDGWGNRCHVCEIERKRSYYHAHKTEERERKALLRITNKEQLREDGRRWRQQFSQRHPTRNKESSKKWYEQNKVEARAATYRWEKNHPDAMRVIRQKRRVLEANAEGSFTAQEWRDVKQSQDYYCMACGKQEPEIKLTVDHIIPLARGGTNYITNIQGLCGFCNSKKGAKVAE